MPSYQRRFSHPEPSHDITRCVADGSGKLVFVSPSLGWMLGKPASDLTGKPLHCILDMPNYRAGMDHVSEQSTFCDIVLMRQDRDPLITGARLDWVSAPNGKPFTVISLDPENRLKKNATPEFRAEVQEFARFISEADIRDAARPAPEAIAATACITSSEGEFRHFLNLTSNLFGVYTRDMGYVRVNPAFNRVLGFDDADLASFPFIDLIHPDERDHVMNLMHRMIQSSMEQDVTSDFECRARCKDGSFRWIEWNLKASVDGFIYIVGSDVTSIKEHEVELLRREQQLAEAQRIAHMGHWYLDVRQDVMEWSDQIYDIFGVDKFTFTPTVDTVSATLVKKDLGRIYKSFQRAIVRKKDYDLEFSIRRSSGGIRYVRCEGRCKINPKTGEVETLYGIMQDITERTLHEKALREAKEAAESAYASKTRFLANMSHELRTPLNAIIGFSEMMQRQLLGPVGNARYLEYIGGIRQSGEHLLDLINDILDMSKIEIGKYELYTEELNVGKIIRLAVHMVEGRAHEALVKLVANDIPDDIQITADRRAYMQVLLNLLSNAIKFTEPGGTVEIRCFRQMGGVAITVADTGIGIPKDKIGVVTMPFEQVSSEFTRNHEGSGLGLAITKDLIELHGGMLDIESEVGVGTTVTVLMPDEIPAVMPSKSHAAGGF